MPAEIDPYFIPFVENIEGTTASENVDPFLNLPPELAQQAAENLQVYLETQNDFDHNFGLNPKAYGKIIGKMFGVLVVRTKLNQIGYLAAFSGKMGGHNTHKRFVPPIYDMLSESGFISAGMENLKVLTVRLELAIEEGDDVLSKQTHFQRAQLSKQLQEQLFNEYNFVNSIGVKKNVIDIFKEYGYRYPPSAAGECSAPKLFQYAFQNGFKPLAIAEFWWGQSPKSNKWKHKQYYPACEEKCRPILDFMLTS